MTCHSFGSRRKVVSTSCRRMASTSPDSRMPSLMARFSVKYTAHSISAVPKISNITASSPSPKSWFVMSVDAQISEHMA